MLSGPSSICIHLKPTLAQAAHAQSHGGPISQEDEEQLQYANMLIDVSHNRNSDACHVLQEIDEDLSTIGFPFVQYFLQDDHERALEWLYPGGQQYNNFVHHYHEC
jgi:hypothetical protein